MLANAGTLSDYQFMRRHTGSQKRAEKAKEAWGASLNSLQDVYRVFTKYTSGRPQLICSGVLVFPPSTPQQRCAESMMGLQAHAMRHAGTCSCTLIVCSSGALAQDSEQSWVTGLVLCVPCHGTLPWGLSR